MPRSSRPRVPASSPQSIAAPAPATHLLVVSGLRPEILTSTIWALAEARRVPAIPDRITVLTTVPGRDAIRRELFTAPGRGQPCVWDALRAALAARGHDVAGRLRFGDTAQDVRVFTAPDGSNRSRELADLTTERHFEEAADTILDAIREVTEIGDTRLIAGVAGGRNPLVSLMAAALGFLGRPQDRLVHALIDAPFDSPSLAPPFFFPAPEPARHTYFDRAKKSTVEIPSAAAGLSLIDLPFVRLRLLFAREAALYRSRFSVLARAYAERVGEEHAPIVLTFDDTQGRLTVNGKPIPLRGQQHPFFAFLYERWRQGLAPVSGHDRIHNDLVVFLREWKVRHPERHFERKDDDWLLKCSMSDIARKLSALRECFKNEGMESVAKRFFPDSGPVGIPLPPDTVPPRERAGGG